MSRVNSKHKGATSVTSFDPYYCFCLYFTRYSSVSIVDFEEINAVGEPRLYNIIRPCARGSKDFDIIFCFLHNL